MKYTFLINLTICLIAYALQKSDTTCRGISRGREFVVGFTSNARESVGELHILVVAFSDNPTTVTISSRRVIYNGKPYQLTFELEAHGYRRITIPNEFQLDVISGRSDKVLAISASSDVSVYGMNYEAFTTDAFLALPNNQLGMSYVVASVMTLQPGRASSLLSVIGVYDNTNIDITISDSASYDNQNYLAGDVISFQLDSHEIVQILGAMGSDLTGSIIRGTRPIAAHGGHICANTDGSFCDVLSEQLIPVDSWGRSHIYTSTGTPGDVSGYRIVSFFEGTVVSVPGAENTTLNAGEFLEVSLPGNGIISSSLPASVTQILQRINGRIVDPSIIQVPSEEQFAHVFGFATPPKSGGDDGGFFNIVNIVVKYDECDTVTLNGQLVQCDTRLDIVIPGTQYAVLRQSLPKGEGVYFIEQGVPTATSPMSVIVYGYEDDETYGYAAGLSLPSQGRLLSVKPFLVRENGGDIITTTLPCLQKHKNEKFKIICRFRQNASGFEIKEPGILVEFVQVICPTKVFSSTGLTTLDVSLDGGDTYPYVDTIYIASQYIVQPKISIKDVQFDFGFIDLSEKEEISLLWNLYEYNVTHVDISIIFVRDNEEYDWTNEIPLETDIVNKGVYNISRENLQKVFSDHKDLLSNDRIILNIMFLVKTESSLFQLGDGFITSFQIQLKHMKTVVRDECSKWISVLENGFPLPNLPPCPCTLSQARVDTRYKESSFGISIFHPGALECYRRNAEDSPAGQQCCYHKNGRLLLAPLGGGTADTYAPGGHSTLKHIQNDVLPWIACCYLSNNVNNCRRYYKFRPSDDCSRYVPPRPTTGTGDPHFITLDQATYTFNAVGEFTLLETELYNISFQGRMEQVPGVNASVFSAFALRGEGLPVVQVQRSSLNQTLVLLDGKELINYHQGKLVPSFKFEKMQLDFNTDQSKVTIELSFGFVITIIISPNMMSYFVDLEDTFKGNVRGLLGNFNDDPRDDLMLPNGTVLSLDSNLENIHYNFGLQWTVAPSNSIFTYLASTNYKFYNNPAFVPNFVFPNSSLVSQDIKNLCGNNLPCLFDAINTGSLEFANATLVSLSEYTEKRETLNKIVICKYPIEFDNGQLNETLFYLNSTYKYICKSGFFPIGSDIARCGANGMWVTTLPHCVSYWIVMVGGLFLLIELIACGIFIKLMCCSSKGRVV